MHFCLSNRFCRLEHAAELISESPAEKVGKYLDEISIQLERLLTSPEQAELLRKKLDAGELEDGRWAVGEITLD